MNTCFLIFFVRLTGNHYEVDNNKLTRLDFFLIHRNIMADNDIAVTVNSVKDEKASRSLKRKLDEDEDDHYLNRLELRKQYFQVKKIHLGFEDYERLLSELRRAHSFDDKKDFSLLRHKVKKIQKRAIDYVGIWDARTVEKALNWLAVHPEEDCRRSFVQVVLKEQPEKNFSKALKRVCEAWDEIRDVYTYRELFDDKAKSDKVKLEKCDWLGTETKERDVIFHNYRDLVDRLEEKWTGNINDFIFLDYSLSTDRYLQAKYAIDYVSVWDARTAEEALNWLVVVPNRFLARQVIESVCVEQPGRNFWKALDEVCRAWDGIRKWYWYEEMLFLDTANKVKLRECCWLVRKPWYVY